MPSSGKFSFNHFTFSSFQASISKSSSDFLVSILVNDVSPLPELEVEENLFDFYRDLTKPILRKNYTDFKKEQFAAGKEAAKQLKLKSLSSILSIWSTRSIKCLSVSNKILTKKDCLIQTVKNPFPHLYQKKRLQMPISQMAKMTRGRIHLR